MCLGPTQRNNKQSKGVSRQISHLIKTIKIVHRSRTLGIATYNHKLIALTTQPQLAQCFSKSTNYLFNHLLLTHIETITLTR